MPAMTLQIKAITNGLPWVLSVFAVPVLAMLVFAVQTSLRGGVQVSERVRKAGGSVFLNQWVMEYGYWWLNVPVRLLVKYQITPNAITWTGCGVVFVGCVLAALGYFGLAGPLVLCGSLSDMLDGIVARERGLSSDAGEFIDSMVDRYADVALYGGLCVYYGDRAWAQGLVLFALLGTVVVSYARAKAESLGVNDAPGSPMRRAERAVYLGFSIFLAPVVSHFVERGSSRPLYPLVLLACVLIGAITNLSAMQMMRHIGRALRPDAAK
ncbi:MAG: CDP-alcohol phosphatidyltransferase family protein [Deltaproteobacteria bacterium]|nr:MAG: CDP-alcohol phosphatidyltransferase family protein [Deltaproteobacteria bacterium]